MKRVLILDDDELSLEMMETLLEFNQLSATKVKSPIEAVQLALKGDFDVIITDYMMPGMNGLTFAKILKEAAIKSKIIVTSAYTKDLFEEELFSAGVSRLFKKPVDVDELLKYIKQL